MKILVISIGLVAVLFLSATTSVEAQKRKAISKSNRSAATAQAGKCSAVVRDDLLPNKAAVVVMGCDSIGGLVTKPLGGGLYDSTFGWAGIVVFDAQMNLIFKWDACSACGGFFSSFAGTKKVRGHNALMINLVNGPVADATGQRIQLTLPLYFNGKEFKFAERDSSGAAVEP